MVLSTKAKYIKRIEAHTCSKMQAVAMCNTFFETANTSA